jgi:hypothetical protein
MIPDNTLGGHQWTELSDTDTYYLQRRMSSTQHGGSENVVYEFVVYRNNDLVIINGSERMNKLSARMRWNYLMKEGWKQTK